MTDREFDFSGPPPPDFGESLRALCFDFARQSDKPKHNKLWVDDTRDPPDDTWQVARSAPEAVAIILDRLVWVAAKKVPAWEHISLDHDLGPPHLGTGVEVMYMILRHQALMISHLGLHTVVTCHSANPVGRARIQACIDIYCAMVRVDLED